MSRGRVGDIDADGVGALAVGAIGDDDGGPDRGAVWILFLPEPDPKLLLVSAIGVLIVLHRMRRLRVR